MFKIKDFLSSINKRGVLPTNRYLLSFAPPNYMRSGGNVLPAPADLLTIRCESVQIPGVSLQTVDGPPRAGYGPIETIPNTLIFDDITAVFTVDANSDIHNFFYTWMNSIVNFHSKGLTQLKDARGPVSGMKTYEVGYKDDYVTDLTIDVFNANDEKVLTAKAYRAFPKLLPSFDMSWASTDEVVRLNVPFTYTDFEVEYNKNPLKLI